MLKINFAKDGSIVIKLPKSDLARATRYCPALEHYDEESGDFLAPKITDAHLFAKEVYSALMSEEEDGTNLVHLMFDKAIENAIENGAEGILMPGDDGYGRKKRAA